MFQIATCSRCGKKIGLVTALVHDDKKLCLTCIVDDERAEKESRLRQKQEPQPQPQLQPKSASIDELEALRDSGEIPEEVFEDAKKSLQQGRPVIIERAMPEPIQTQPKQNITFGGDSMNKTARDPFSGEIIGEERATTLPTDSETESVIISTKNVTPILLLLVIASGVLSLFSYKPPIGAEEILIPILASLITVIVLGWFIVLFFRALSTIIRLLLDIKYLLTALTKR